MPESVSSKTKIRNLFNYLLRFIYILSMILNPSSHLPSYLFYVDCIQFSLKFLLILGMDLNGHRGELDEMME